MIWNDSSHPVIPTAPQKQVGVLALMWTDVAFQQNTNYNNLKIYLKEKNIILYFSSCKVNAFCPPILPSHYIKVKHFKKWMWLFEAVREICSTICFSRQLLLCISLVSYWIFIWPVTPCLTCSTWCKTRLTERQLPQWHPFSCSIRSNQPFSESLFSAHFWIKAILPIMGKKVKHTADLR